MTVKIIQGDALAVIQTLPDESVNCCVTSPPYWGLRNYGVEGQLGLEKTPEEYVSKMVDVFREVRRVLRGDGTLWLNLGDSYSSGTKGSGGRSKIQLSNAGSFHNVNQRLNCVCKPKDLVGIPWMVAFALRADGWYLRQDIIWAKPNPMPESARDRCTKAHEYIFLMSKSQRYYYNNKAIQEDFSDERCGNPNGGGNYAIQASKFMGKGFQSGLAKGKWNENREHDGRNKRSVWTVSTATFTGAHFATFPPKLIEPCILAGCPIGGTVLDPFGGSGTVGMVAEQNGRNSILIELNPEYVEMARRRTAQKGLFAKAMAI